MIGEATGETPKAPEPVTQEPQKPGIAGSNPLEVSKKGGYSFSLEGRGRVQEPELTTPDVLKKMREKLAKERDADTAAAIRRNIRTKGRQGGL